MRHLLLSTTVTLLATTLLASSTLKAETNRVIIRHATGVCQPSTPLELGGLRFRPLGIFNNKTTDIYVSCTPDTEYVADVSSTDFSLHFTNQGDKLRTVTCSIVGGSRAGGSITVTAAVVVAANASEILNFSNVSRDSTLGAYGISCLLPPRVEFGQIMMGEYDSGGEL